MKKLCKTTERIIYTPNDCIRLEKICCAHFSRDYTLSLRFDERDYKRKIISKTAQFFNRTLARLKALKQKFCRAYNQRELYKCSIRC